MIILLLDAPLFYLAVYQFFSGEYIMPTIVLAFSLLSIYKKKWLYVRTIALSVGFILLFFLEHSQTVGYFFPLLSAAGNLLQLFIKSKFSGFELEGKEQAGQRKHYLLFAVVSITGVISISTLLFFEFSPLALVFSCATIAIIVGIMNVYINSSLTRSIWSSYTIKQLMAGYYVPYMRGGQKHPSRLLDDPVKGIEEARAKLLLKMPTALNVKNIVRLLAVVILILVMYSAFKWFESQYGEFNTMLFRNIEENLKLLNNAGGELF